MKQLKDNHSKEFSKSKTQLINFSKMLKKKDCFINPMLLQDLAEECRIKMEKYEAKIALLEDKIQNL